MDVDCQCWSLWSRAVDAAPSTSWVFSDLGIRAIICLSVYLQWHINKRQAYVEEHGRTKVLWQGFNRWEVRVWRKGPGATCALQIRNWAWQKVNVYLWSLVGPLADAGIAVWFSKLWISSEALDCLGSWAHCARRISVCRQESSGLERDAPISSPVGMLWDWSLCFET